jgi:hypothetical protein
MRPGLFKIIATFIFVAIPLFTFVTLGINPGLSMMNITQEQKSYLIALSFIEALAFETGILSPIFLWPMLKEVDRRYVRKLKIIVVSASLLLISWWPHDYAHAHNQSGLSGTISIEYLFHVTSMIIGIVIILQLASLIQALIQHESDEIS